MPVSEAKRYWKSLAERDGDEGLLDSAADEFAGPAGPGTGPFSRRGFLRAAGFSAAAAVLSGCSRAPVEKAVPYLIKPEEITPGRALYYASTCGGCSAGCGVLVKNRDGRPIKIEGNPEHPLARIGLARIGLARGGLCATGQAYLLGLYDSQRLRHPLHGGEKAAWPDVDRNITAQLQTIRQSGGAVRFLTGTVVSPTLHAAILRFLAEFADARHVTYDALSSAAILDAHEQTHGARLLPHYRFDRAEAIVSFDADFLGTWVSAVEFTSAYSQGRRPQGSPPAISYHVQFEARMSLTGAKADRRVRLAPPAIGAALTHLAAKLKSRHAQRDERAVPLEAQQQCPVDAALLDDLAERLWQARGHSLVVSGSQEVAVQVVVNYINYLLGNYGSTLDLAAPSYQKQGSDRDLLALLEELRNGKVSALFVAGANPVYDLPGGKEIAASLRRVPLVVSFASHVDETAAAAGYVCPDHHTLESWGDSEPVAGVVSILQPVIHPLGATRSLLESLAAWTLDRKPGEPATAYDILRAHWERELFPRQAWFASFQEFWDRAVHDGYTDPAPKATRLKPFNLAAVKPVPRAAEPGEFSLVLYPTAGMLDGRHAHNAWLQELPDPITKIAWDNYACFAPEDAARLGIQDGDVVQIEVAGGGALELPAFVQPGQQKGVVAVPLGYGRKGTERFAQVGPRWLFARASGPGPVGKNAAPLAAFAGGTLQYNRAGVAVRRTGRQYPLASTQSHHTLSAPPRLQPAGAGPRPIIQETTLAEYARDPAAGTHAPHHGNEDLWPPDHKYRGYRWGMVVDLNACTGCAACVVACQVENNIPVVGYDEMRRRRQMHWLRVDRYYSETRHAGDAEPEVDVAHQPMMCAHCDKAGCETVCPVLATVHSEDGINQQIYNRCVGTRYCSNNCPYKARRFNWFEYARQDRLQNLVLNPDVTVRSRGVMEKCTFCIQRVQEAKIEAKRRGLRVADGMVQTACQQSCPAGAIVFGDLNDPNSRAAQLVADPRRYRVLEELNVGPAVSYLRLVRNRVPGEGGERHG